MRILISGGRVIDPATDRNALSSVAAENGVIVATEGTTSTFDQTIDATGMWVCPGFVDLHSVLQSEVDEIAALSGGFTTVVTTPDSMAAVSSPRIRILKAGALTVGLDGLALGEINDGEVCLSQGFRPLTHANVLRRALQYASQLNVPVLVHSEDPNLSGRGVVGEGVTATRLGLPTVPKSAETSIVARDLELVEETNGRLHFSHLTCARSVALVADAKRRGLRVTADVTPHHLLLDERSAENYALRARVWPALQSEADAVALRVGLAEGVIDAVACDHRRVNSIDLEHPFEACLPGCASFLQALGAAFEIGLSPRRIVECLSLTPSRILGLASGTLAIGARADICIVDPSSHAVRHVISGGAVHVIASQRS